MHISDGVLPTTIALGGYAAATAIAAWSVRKTAADDLPKVAVVTSSFFVASLVHVPLGPTSVHLLIPGLIGILLRQSAFVSILLGLLLQSLLFQFGGITALGANALLIGIPALTCGFLFSRIRGTTLQNHVAAAAFCGGLGTALAALFLALFLAAGGDDFGGVAKIALAAHLPVIIIESILSAFTVSFLFKVKPDLLGPGFFQTEPSVTVDESAC